MRPICAVLVTVLLMLLSVTTAATQQSKPAKTIVRDDNNCESNKGYFDYVAAGAGHDGLIIIIARLGEGESSRIYNRRRLHNISTYLNYIRKISKERIVTAEGERVTGRGRVEVYADGKLMIVFTVARNQDLAGGDCEQSSSSLYYPKRKK